ncbi:MAG: GspH/FimT family pseudopilin [Pseudomonadota bacterium]
MHLHPRRLRGFTLIELLVVLAILAGVVGALTLRFDGALAGMETRSAARDVASALRYARGRAIAGQQETGVAIEVEGLEYRLLGLDEERRHSLGDRIAIDLLTDQTSLLSETEGAIRFFPDGSSTGGEVILSSDAGRYTITIDWLTGRVRIDAGALAE